MASHWRLFECRKIDVRENQIDEESQVIQEQARPRRKRRSDEKRSILGARPEKGLANMYDFKAPVSVAFFIL